MQKAKNSAFDDITVSWEGREVTIPAHKVMGALLKVEAHITLAAMATYLEQEDIPLGKLAAAYGNVLRYAGTRVTDEEVYTELLKGDEATSIHVVNTLLTILQMLMPPHLRAQLDQAMAEGVDPGAILGDTPVGKSTTASSKKRTKRRSRRNGSRPQNSGTSTPRNSGS